MSSGGDLEEVENSLWLMKIYDMNNEIYKIEVNKYIIIKKGYKKIGLCLVLLRRFVFFIRSWW